MSQHLRVVKLKTSSVVEANYSIMNLNFIMKFFPFIAFGPYALTLKVNPWYIIVLEELGMKVCTEEIVVLLKRHVLV